MKPSNSLWLFTSSFPYGTSETFLESEIVFLAEAFEEIYIVSVGEEVVPIRPTPSNCEVVRIKPRDTFRVPFWLIMLWFKELFRISVPLSKWRYEFARLKSLVGRSKTLSEFIDQRQSKKNDVFYSYWFDEWAIILSLLKQDKVITSFISRAHGFDLYEERGEYKRHLYKPFIMQQMSKLYSISESGASYLQSLYPQWSDKLKIARLGTNDLGMSQAQLNNEQRKVIVSCSNVIALKRVEDIAKAISSIPDVKWVHFGAGKLLEKLKEKCIQLKKENQTFQYELRGQVTNAEVLDFYKTNAVSLFVNFSTSEGIPVSIMEAMSFGIPCVVPDVGGVSELVNNKNGLLLDSSASIADLKAGICKVLNSNNYLALRYNARQKWLADYCASKNYKTFVKLIKSAE